MGVAVRSSVRHPSAESEPAEREPGRALTPARAPAWAAGWGAAGALAGLSVLHLEPNLLEEGLVVHVAQRIAQGEHLYRDVLFFTGPLPFEALALAFRAFGESVLVARAAMLPLIAVAAACAFGLARRAGAGPLAHVAAAVYASAPVLLFPLLGIYFYTTIALYGVAIAAYCALRGVSSSRWAFAAGVAIAAVALCKQVFGVALAAGLVAAVAAAAGPGERLRRAGVVTLGGVTVAALTLALYAARGDLGALVYALAALPFELEASFRAPYLNLWPPGELAPAIDRNELLYLPGLMYLSRGLLTEVGPGAIAATQAVYALPFAALAATAARRLAGPLPAAVWIHAAALVTLLTNVYPRGDWGHVAFTVPPALVQLLLLVGPVRARAWGPASAVACFALYSAVVVTATWLGTLASRTPLGERVPLHAVSPAYRIGAVPRVVEYLDRRVYPDEEIFVARQEPLLYFATGTRNPTPFTGVWMGLHERQRAAILPALARIRYVVMSDIDQPLYAYYADQLPEVQRHLERHYRVPPDFPIDATSWIQVLERAGDRGPALFDFVERRDRGRAWVRDREGRVTPATVPVPRLPVRQNRRPLPIAVGAGGGGIDFALDVPHRAVFQADLGLLGMISTDGIHYHPRAARHALAVSRDGREFEQLDSRRLADRHPDWFLRWRPFEVDLGRYGGERVTLRLEVVADAPLRERLAWIGSPRLAHATGGAS